jgi:fibronectin-binding autotransporter adhesin
MRSLPTKLVASVIAVLAWAGSAAAQPTADDTWNNFVLTTATWATGTNWLSGTAPTSSTDRVLKFVSSPLQTAGGYTSNYTNGGAAFDLNSLVFASSVASNPSLILSGNAAGDTLRFNTSSTSVAPSIWQTGSGRVLIRNGTATTGLTINAPTLQINGDGIGGLDLGTSANLLTIAQGAGNSGILIQQTGTRGFDSGAVVQLAGVNTFAGGVNLTAGNLQISNASALGGGTLTIGGGTVQFDPAATTGAASPIATFTGPITGAAGISVVNNAGSNIYNFTGANGFAGAVSINDFGNTVSTISVGTATIGTGTMAGASGFTITGNSTLTLNNTIGVLTRLNTGTAPTLTLNRGNYSLIGNATASAAEAFGTFTVNGFGSVSVLGASATAQTTTQTFASLNRGSANGTLAFIATNLGSGSGAGESIIKFTTDPGGSIGGGGGAGTTTRSILPYAYADSAASVGAAIANVLGVVRWDSPTQRIVPLNTATEYATNLYLVGTSAPTANHRYASTAALPNASSVVGLNSARTINSLVLDTNTAAANRVGVSVAGTGTLTVGSGTILFGTNGSSTNTAPSNASMINVGTLAFGGTTGYIHAVAPGLITSPITGSAGVVKSGTAALTLTGNNTFTGGLFVNGQVNFTTDSNLGNTSEAITVNSGLLTGIQYLPNNLFTTASGTSVTVNRPIVVGPSGAVISASLGGSTLNLPGQITGSGQVFKVGAGVLNLTNINNTFTGTLSSFAGVLAVQTDGSIGNAANGIALNGGTFQVNTSFGSNRDVFVAATTNIMVPAGVTWTLNGNLTSHNSSFAPLKIGAGDLILTNTNTMLGSFQVGVSSPATTVFANNSAGAPTSAGRVILQNANGALPLASSVNVLANGEFIMDNTAAINNNRVGSVTVGLIGGNVTLKGNGGGSVTEAVGALSNNNASNPYGGILTISTPGGSGQVTTLNALSYTAAPGTLIVRGDNLSAGSGDRTALILGANPTQSQGLIASWVGNTTSSAGEPNTFMTTSATTVAAPNSAQFAVVPFSTYTAGGTLGAGAAANTYDITTPSTFAGASAANALRIQGTTLDLGAGTLTLGAAHILSTGGSAASISNGTLAFAANNARFTVASGSDLTVSTSTTGTAGLIKSGSGTLILNTASSITVTAGTTFNAISQGTLRYGVANALSTAGGVFINAGATLDINNTVSTLGNINGYGNISLGTGSLTVGSIAQVQPWGGALSGSAASSFITTSTQNVQLAGDSTAAFSGGVQVLGGAANAGTGLTGLILASSGALGSGTSPILLGATSGTQQASMSLLTAITSFTRDITVQAGSAPATPHTFAIGAGTVNISSNIILNQQLRITNFNNNTGNGILSGTISGAGNLNIFFGSWTFNGNNTWSGGITIDTGPFAGIGIGTDSNAGAGTGPFGTGTVTVTSTGGILRADGGARTITNAFTLNSAAIFGSAGTNPLTLNGNISLNAGATAPNINIMNTARTTFGGVISNTTVGFNKVGPGTLELKGANNYSGTTTVNAGILLADNTSGSATGTSGVTVNGGAILAGTGAVAGPITLNAGILAPGDLTNVGTLATSALPVFTSGIFSTNLAALGTGNYGQLNVAVAAGNNIDLGAANAVTLSFSGIYTGATNGTFVIIEDDNGTTVSNRFANFPSDGQQVFVDPTTSTPYFIFYGSYVGLPGSVVIAPIPEPSTMALGAVAAGALALLRRRKRAVAG